MSPPPVEVNPYIVGPPITERNWFYGRDDLYADINDYLASETRIILLIGQRRIGKSSVLRQIPNFVDSERNLAVQLDLQGYASRPLGEVLSKMAEEVVKAINGRTDLPPLFKDSDIREDPEIFRVQFIPRVLELIGDKRLLLLLDEFDVLGDSQVERAGGELFLYLQRLLQQREVTNLVLMPVIGRRPEEVPTLLNIFREAVRFRIGRLDEGQTKKLITQPAQGTLEFADEAINAIYQLTSGHPYLTQLMCSEVFRSMRRRTESPVTPSDVEAVVDRALSTGASGLAWFYTGIPVFQRVLLAAIAESYEYTEDGRDADSQSTNLLTQQDISGILEKNGISLQRINVSESIDQLVDWDIVSERKEFPGHYRVTVEMVRRWMVKEHPLFETKRDLELVDKVAVQNYEGALEAHRSRDLQQAIIYYRAALTINSNHYHARLGLAEAMLENGNPYGALEQYVWASRFDPYEGEYGMLQALIAFGRSRIEEGNLSEASKALYAALLISPESSEAQALLARADPSSVRKGWRAALVGFLTSIRGLDWNGNVDSILVARSLTDPDVAARRAIAGHLELEGSTWRYTLILQHHMVEGAVKQAQEDEDLQVRRLVHSAMRDRSERSVGERLSLARRRVLFNLKLDLRRSKEQWSLITRRLLFRLVVAFRTLFRAFRHPT